SGKRFKLFSSLFRAFSGPFCRLPGKCGDSWVQAARRGRRRLRYPWPATDKAIAMPVRADQPPSGIRLRPGQPADVDALFELERGSFSYDQMSRRSIRRFLSAPGAAVIVAEHDGRFAGYALVLFPPRSRVARLYSLAVAPASAGRGIGTLLIAACE